MQHVLLLVIGFFLGLVHSFDLDHLAAVTGLVARRPGPARAIGLGISWGLGHAGVIFLVGLGAFALRVAVPGWVEYWAELLVGVILAGIGVCVLAETYRAGGAAQLHSHADGTLHAHAGQMHLHPHSVAVGVVHGLAGTAGVMVLVPVALMSSIWETGLFVVAFGLGNIVAMGVFAYATARSISLARFRPALFRAFRAGSGLANLALGLAWI